MPFVIVSLHLDGHPTVARAKLALLVYALFGWLFMQCGDDIGGAPFQTVQEETTFLVTFSRICF
jgi:hypothetical protein